RAHTSQNTHTHMHTHKHTHTCTHTGEIASEREMMQSDERERKWFRLSERRMKEREMYGMHDEVRGKREGERERERDRERERYGEGECQKDVMGEVSVSYCCCAWRSPQV